MICDVHAHYIPKQYSEFMGERFPPVVGRANPVGIARHPVSDSGADIQGRFELMDAAGVETQILSTHRQPYLPDEAECVRGLHLLNDGYAELAARYPKRIRSYVMLPLPHIDAALREMERGLDQLGCVGVNMNISCLGRSIAEPEFDPIYAEMNRRGAILFVHPSVTGVCSPVINDWGFRASIGNSIEDAMFVAHMIKREIPSRYPNIRFIVPHLGGPIPMLLNRLDQQGARDLGALPEPPSVTARRFWYDTVCYGSKAALCCACEAFGVEKIVTGSDYPVLQDYESYIETFAFIGRIGLPAVDADQILHHNAHALFGFAH
jgi:predicted TIM-barrel fold metal-dependent hydrolase